MFTLKMQSYRFNKFELDLIDRLSTSTYLKEKFHFSRYPEVYFGNRLDFPVEKKELVDICENEETYIVRQNDIDSLGCYRYNQDKKLDGHIEIYRDRIDACAKRIFSALNMDFHQVRSLLQTIVLVHEFGHWFTHACYADLRDSRMSKFSSMSKNTIETMAQLSVIWAVGNLKNPMVKQLLKIMNHLTQGQSLPYRLYLELGTKQSQKQKIINRFIKMLDFEEDNIEYLLLKTPDYLKYQNIVM